MYGKKEYNRVFFKTWSHDMAYILGFLYADGNIVLTKRGNHYIAIYIADLPLLRSIRKCVASTHRISKRARSGGMGYRIQIGSKEWFTDLKALGLFPNKTKRMSMPDVPDDFFGDFVRGYFDGDGNVWSGLIHKDRHTPMRTLQAAFTSCSKEFLESLRIALQEKGLARGSLYMAKKGTYGRLAFSILDALKLYEIMYNGPCTLYLKRKRRVFEQFAEARKRNMRE